MHIVVRSAVPAVVALLLSAPLFAASPDPARAAPAGDGISLDVSLGTDVSQGACGTDTTLQVTRGDQINVCYVVTNNSDTTLNYQKLSDDLDGIIFPATPITLAPGASYQYNRFLVATDSIAPTSTWTAYDVHPDYVFWDYIPSGDTIFVFGFDRPAAMYNFIDISSTSTSLLLNDDDYTVADIGFPFTFYGETASALTVSNNGGILFDQVPGQRGRDDYLSPVNRTLPDHRIGLAMLPWWDDIQQDYIDGIGNVFVQTLGDAPNRQFVIEWYNLPVSFGGGETITFEAVLYEGSNYIQFEYQDVTCGTTTCDDGASATIGVNADATTSNQYSFDQPTLVPQKAILYTPSTPVTYTASQQVTLDVGAPVISVDPTSFDKTLTAGTSTTDTLTIGNSGNRDLTWNIGEVAARAHFPPLSHFALPMGNPDLSDVGPHPIPADAKPTAPHFGVPFADGVPAFGNDVSTSLLVSLDVTQPATLNTIASLNGLQLLAGDFAGEDFSTLYGIDYQSFILYKVDTTTDATTPIDITEVPPPASADAWNGMSWDATTSTMYAVTSGGGRTKQSWLFKLDLQHAIATLVGEITGVGDPTGDGVAIIDIAVDSNGLLYGVDIITDTLVAIDKNTGEASTIGSIGFDANFNADLDFDDYTGTLYFAAYDSNAGLEGMYTINTETGEATLVSPIGADPTTASLDAMGIARLSGVCAYPNDVPWLSYSSGRGSTAPGGTTPITVTFDATDLAAGSYSANICIYNNDLTNKRLAVPVSLTVQ